MKIIIFILGNRFILDSSWQFFKIIVHYSTLLYSTTTFRIHNYSPSKYNCATTSPIPVGVPSDPLCRAIPFRHQRVSHPSPPYSTVTVVQFHFCVMRQFRATTVVIPQWPIPQSSFAIPQNIPFAFPPLFLALHTYGEQVLGDVLFSNILHHRRISSLFVPWQFCKQSVPLSHSEPYMYFCQQ